MPPEMEVRAVIPQLRTTDLEGSIAFHVERLGFALAFRYGDFYAGIQAGRQEYHLKLADQPDPGIAEVAASGHFHLYFAVENAMACAEALRDRGVALLHDLHDTDWGTQEFVVRDDQGHTLYFGAPRS
jgi:catechol 2,3-dioxygenase-like lactoylglutathione lyase family enzyme